MSTLDFQTPFQIGPVTIRNRVVLAPMSGVTDLPFRQLALRYGAGLAVTEMVASRELVTEAAESWARLKSAGFRPHMVQLAGREAHWMALAAKVAEDNGADIIDINMGCPAKKVIGGYSGSALMRDPDHALSLIEATVKAVSVPVTVKMRLGWDENSLNAPEIAKRAEDAGVQLITVHGRTRMQFYEGKADWDAILKVQQVLTVPLIANGDVETTEDMQTIAARSGATAVMIGRASQGRPWLAGVLAGQRSEPDHAEVADIAVEHYEMMLSFYGSQVAVRHARKHLRWYLERYAPGLEVDRMKRILTSDNASDVAAALRSAILDGGDKIRQEKVAA